MAGFAEASAPLSMIVGTALDQSDPVGLFESNHTDMILFSERAVDKPAPTSPHQNSAL
jgi:hypothetical protein